MKEKAWSWLMMFWIIIIIIALVNSVKLKKKTKF